MLPNGLVRGRLGCPSEALAWHGCGCVPQHEFKKQTPKASTKSSKGAARKPRAARAAVAKRVHAAPRAAKHAKAAVEGLPKRATRLVKSHPVRVLLGAAAMGLAVAKLKNLI